MRNASRYCVVILLLAPLAASGQIVTDDLLYSWDASDNATATATEWDSQTANTGAGGGRWNLDTTGADAVTREVLGPNNTTFTHAYSFKGGSGVAGDGTPVQSTAIFDGSGGGATDPFDVGSSAMTDRSATFEAWLRPGDLSGNEIIFETGGTTRGVGLTLSDSTLQFSVKDGSAGAQPSGTELLTHTLTGTTDFLQVVLTINDSSNAGTGGTQDIALYVDGLLVDNGSFDNDHVFGTGNATLGGANSGSSFGGGANGGAFSLGNYDGFLGEIAAFRVYDDALTAPEVLQNFQAFAAVPEPTTIAIWTLLGASMLGFCFVRRRGR